MKAHIGVDTAHGLVHTVEVTTGKVSDDSLADTLLHGEEATALGDRGYADRTREPDRPRCQRRLNIPQKWRLGIPHFVTLGVLS
jgi:hypothetical protein